MAVQIPSVSDPVKHEQTVRDEFEKRSPDLPERLPIFLWNISKLPDVAQRKRLVQDLIIPKLAEMAKNHYTKNLMAMPFVLSSITKLLDNDNSVAKDFVYKHLDPNTVHEFVDTFNRKVSFQDVFNEGNPSEYRTPLWSLLDSLGDETSKKEYISHFLTEAEPDDYTTFFNRINDHEPEIAPLFADYFGKEGQYPTLQDVHDFISNHHRSPEDVSSDTQDLFSKRLKEHIEKEGNLFSWYGDISSLPKKLRDKHIDDFLQNMPSVGRFLSHNKGGKFYQDYKDKIDKAIESLPPSSWSKREAESVISKYPKIAENHVESFLDHPDAGSFLNQLRQIGNDNPDIARKKADLFLKQVKKERGFDTHETSNGMEFLSPEQQKRVAQEAFSGKPYFLPVQTGDKIGPFLRAIVPHINNFSADERGRFDNYLDQLISSENGQHGLLSSVAHHGFKGLENIEDYLDQKIPKLKLFGPATFWNQYEWDVEPHHFAVGKSLVTGKPESIVDHRGQAGHSRDHFHLLDGLRLYAQKTQDKIKEKIADGSLKAKDINGKPHLWLYRGVAGNFAKAIRDGIGAGKHNPKDHTVVDTQRASYPASHYESWSTNFDIAKRFANRGIEGHPLDNGVVFGEWVPLDTIAHSGFIDLYPGQTHAHDKEYEFVTHMASETPVREFDPQSIHLNDGKGNYLPAKPAPTVQQPTESPMSKSEKTMDNKPNAHEILSVLHGEARKNKVQDSQQTILDQNAQIKQRIHAVASKIKEVAPQLEQLKNTHPEAFSTLMESIKAMMTMAKQYVPQQQPAEPMQKAHVEVKHPPGVRSTSMITGASADAKPTHRSGKIFTMEADPTTGETKKKKREARSGLIMNPANGAAVSVRQAPHEQRHPDAVKVT